MTERANDECAGSLRACWEEKEKPYRKINREEQHLGALLFSFLINSDYREKFTDLVRTKCEGADPGSSFSIGRKFDDPETEVYLEFSMPRDIWKRIDDDDVAKRRYICDFLKIEDSLPDKKDDFEKFNNKFKNNPGKWRLSELIELFEEVQESKDGQAKLRRAAMLKWAFNAKPDIVLINGGSVLSIELKFESDFSSYPSGKEGKQWDEVNWHEEFRTARDDKHRVRQLELQRFLLEDVLGYDDVQQLIIKKSQSKKHKFYEYPQKQNNRQKKPYAFINWQDISGIIGESAGRDRDFFEFLDENLLLNPEKESK